MKAEWTTQKTNTKKKSNINVTNLSKILLKDVLLINQDKKQLSNCIINNTILLTAKQAVEAMDKAAEKRLESSAYFETNRKTETLKRWNLCLEKKWTKKRRKCCLTELKFLRTNWLLLSIIMTTTFLRGLIILYTYIYRYCMSGFKDFVYYTVAWHDFYRTLSYLIYDYLQMNCYIMLDLTWALIHVFYPSEMIFC